MPGWGWVGGGGGGGGGLVVGLQQIGGGKFPREEEKENRKLGTCSEGSQDNRKTLRNAMEYFAMDKTKQNKKTQTDQSPICDFTHTY